MRPDEWDDRAPEANSPIRVNVAKPTRAPMPVPKSSCFRKVLKEVELFAGHDNIIIVFQGETGTGKTRLACLAHKLSPRAGRRFLSLSLADVSDSLVASELFGHVKGAFTDARKTRLGAFSSANQGTLFLDEISKASVVVQRRLLRVLEEGKFTTLGSDREVTVDVRVLAATNENLEYLVRKGRFLEDLYARLGYFIIEVPPLRERREDIPILAEYFVAEYVRSQRNATAVPVIHPALMQSLQRAPWPRNLRELSDAMKRLVVVSRGAAELTFEHCTGPLEPLRVRSRGRPRKVISTHSIAVVTNAKSKSAAARELDISRSTLYRSLRRAADGAARENARDTGDRSIDTTASNIETVPDAPGDEAN